MDMDKGISNYPEDIQFRNIDISDPNILDWRANRRRRTPIMVEFSDPLVTAVDLARALEAGMNIVKFRMALTTKAERVRMLSRMDKAADRCTATKGAAICHVATTAAIKTWVKKCGISKNSFDEFEKDSEVILTCNQAMIAKCSSKIIYVDYAHIAKDVPIGMEITIGSGKVMMHCLGTVDDTSIKCKVHKAGRIKSMETAYFRGLKHTTPYISKIDINILKFCAQYQVDIIMIYYARDGEMIKKIKHLISKAKVQPLIFSAICHQAGIDHLDGILKESDGIIFCRDYLHFELESREVYRIPMLQKCLAGKCQQAGKPMFISGVLDYVLTNGELCDAEIADVTNALMDGVTGFVFKDCVEINNTIFALTKLNDICCQVEPLTFDKDIFWRMLREFKIPINAAEAAVVSCVAVANQTNSRIIVIPTVTGQTARALLWLRPACIVITLSTRPHTARRLFTCRNVVSLIYTGSTNKVWHAMEEDKIQYAAEFAVSQQLMKYGDMYVSLQRSEESHLFCDMVRVWTVTSSKKMLVECHYGSEDEQSVGSVGEKKPEEKKKRRRQKKKIETNVDEEAKDEEQEDQDHTVEQNGIAIETAVSDTAHQAKSKNEMAEEEEEKEEGEENEDD